VIAPSIYTFGNVTADFRRMTVTVGDTPATLEPKAFEVLGFLIEHRDRLVTKDELLDTVWHDAFVTPNALTRVVSQLRRAFGDEAQEPRYIQTIAKRGYRFIGSVAVTPPPAEVPLSLGLNSLTRHHIHER
jgi:DNA-binding winged helix-turn-helix (wHTH) protein